MFLAEKMQINSRRHVHYFDDISKKIRYLYYDYPILGTVTTFIYFSCMQHYTQQSKDSWPSTDRKEKNNNFVDLADFLCYKLLYVLFICIFMQKQLFSVWNGCYAFTLAVIEDVLVVSLNPA